MELSESTYFQHDIVSQSQRTSTILVEKLLEDVEMLALYVALSSEEGLGSWMYHINDTVEMSDKKRVAYELACLDDLQKDPVGYHYGDCTWACGSCLRCIVEIRYLEVIELKEEYRTMDITEDLLLILLGTDFGWMNSNRSRKEYLKVYNDQKSSVDQLGQQINEAFNLYPLPDSDLKSRYPLWLSLSDEKKEEARQRTNLFRHYMKERPIVDGVPWW